MCPQEALPQAVTPAQAWSCLVSSSLFDLQRAITLTQLSTGPWVWRQRSVSYTGHWKSTAMCSSLLQAIPGFCGISPQTQVSGVCSHKGPCAVNRSSRSTKGMWNLAKGSPSRGAVVQLPRTYFDHRPLGHPGGPPTCPAQLTPLVTGPSPKPGC